MKRNENLSPTMADLIDCMRKNGNKVHRYQGGYWAREGWLYGQGGYFGTGTVEALVGRGLAHYTEWKEGRNMRFPIVAELTGLGIQLFTSTEEE
jgi:hypothetical protein